MENKRKNPRQLFYAVFSFALLALCLFSCKTEPSPENGSADAKTQTAAQEEPEEIPVKQDRYDTSFILGQISELLEKGDYEEALARFSGIKAEDAEKVEIRLLKASALISAGKYSDARAIVNEVLENNPDHIPALFVLSSIEEAQNRTREQRAALERILAKESGNVQALVAMGTLLIRGSAARQAGPYFDRALAADPQNGEALLGRAWVYRNARDVKNAEALLNRAVELYPDWARACHERGRLYKAAGFYQAALADLNKAQALDGNNYFIACDKADALKSLNRKKEALAEYERAIAINPDYFLAYVFSGSLKDELGDLDGAFKDYQALVRLNPDYYFGFEGLGMHLMRLSRWLEARDAFMEAYRRASLADSASPDLGMYALLASVCALRGGARREAQPFMDKALAKLARDSLEYRMLRLYRDWAGDMDITNRIDRERNPLVKSRMLFYLAWYYEIRGNKNLANKFFLQVRDLDVKNMIEWRLNEWILDARGMEKK